MLLWIEWLGMFASQQGRYTHTTFNSPTDAKYSMTRFPNQTIEPNNKEQIGSETKEENRTSHWISNGERKTAKFKERNRKIVGNKKKINGKTFRF